METQVFPEGNDPFRHISCLAEGVCCFIKCYTGRLFWPSANWLPWRRGDGPVLERNSILDVWPTFSVWEKVARRPIFHAVSVVHHRCYAK
jgi:hypothetical protein